MADSFSIRIYEHARDARDFAALNYRTFRDSIPPEEPIDEAFFRDHHKWLLERYCPWDGTRNTILVAEVGGKYAGHCWISTQTDFFTRVEEPWIFDISVMPQFRKRGLASAMLKAAQDFLKERGFKHVGLQVVAHNKPAQSLYEKFGYKPHAISLRRAL